MSKKITNHYMGLVLHFIFFSFLSLITITDIKMIVDWKTLIYTV